MNQQRQILLIGITFIAVITMLFFNIKDKFEEEYRITKKEINGVHEITTIFEVDYIIKNLRGIYQLKEQEADLVKKGLFSKNNTALDNIKKLNDVELVDQYLKINNTLTKMDSFNQYTQYIKLLANKRINVADSSYLLFEGDRTIYFIMTTAILDIPHITENMGQSRALGVGFLNNKKHIKEVSFLLDTNLKSFADKIEHIRFTMNKIDDKKKIQFESLLNAIVTDFYHIKTIVSSLQKYESEISPKMYFLETSKLVNQLKNLFYLSTEILIKKLENREKKLKNKLFMGTVFYILLISISGIIAFIMYRKYDKEQKEQIKKKTDDQFIQLLQEDYLKNNNLKVICNKSLNHIINYFGAINASLYLYNKQNEKLYLTATYGIKYSNLNPILDMHENLIAENILEKKIKIIDTDKKIDLGNIQVQCSKLLTIPIIEFKNSIGTIQLLFDHKYKEIDLDFLQSIISLMGTYINKAQKDEESLQYLKLINKNVLISKTDLDGNIIEVSEHLCKLSQYSKEELIGKNHRIFKHPDMKNEFFQNLWKVIKKGDSWNGEIKNRTKSGDSYWVETYITPDYDISKNIIGYTAIRTNITDKKKIEQIAITDGLTDLYNRRHFDTIFPQQIEINIRHKGLIAFVLIDIDHFKQYNDRYGHQEGDLVLKLVSKTLKLSLNRLDDYTFRLGGEEFGLLYHIDTEEDAIRIANQTIKNIENLNIQHNGNSASKYVTISAGLYIISHTDHTITNNIYKLSDQALYNAKKNGRNQLCTV